MPGSDRPRIGVFAGRLRVSRTAATCGTHERRAAQLCETHHVSEVKQLAALARIQELLTGHGIDYWLFGGWAVDFHAGVVTRVHDDLDIAVWLNDHSRIGELLAADRWRHAPEQHEDGYTGYERGGLRLELAFLERSEDGHIYTPTQAGRMAWPDGTFEGDVVQLLGVRARVITLRALKADKAETRGDPVVAAKDRADLASLSRFT
jgi:Aminoglycoside-2''-adenylyltransferase